MSDSFNHLGSIWYQSEPLEVPYCPNQFLGLDLFCRFLQQTGSRTKTQTTKTDSFQLKHESTNPDESGLHK